MRWWNLVDSLTRLCYAAVALVRLLKPAIPRLLLVVRMVARWMLWRAGRRRGRIVRSWVAGVRMDFEYNRRTGWRLVSWAVMCRDGGDRRATREVKLGMPKKPEVTHADTGVVPRAAAPGRVLDKTPTLAGYLIDMGYEDGGGPRQPSRLFIEATGGEWLIVLKDPTECRQLRARVTDLGTAYAALEALLTSGTCPWEPDLWAANAKGRKKK